MRLIFLLGMRLVIILLLFPIQVFAEEREETPEAYNVMENQHSFFDIVRCLMGTLDAKQCETKQIESIIWKLNSRNSGVWETAFSGEAAGKGIKLTLVDPVCPGFHGENIVHDVVIEKKNKNDPTVTIQKNDAKTYEINNFDIKQDTIYQLSQGQFSADKITTDLASIKTEKDTTLSNNNFNLVNNSELISKGKINIKEKFNVNFSTVTVENNSKVNAKQFDVSNNSILQVHGSIESSDEICIDNSEVSTSADASLTSKKLFSLDNSILTVGKSKDPLNLKNHVETQEFKAKNTDLNIDGKIKARTVNIYAGTIFKGVGTIIANNINFYAGSMVRPGNSIGIANYVGNTAFNNVTTEIEINNSNNDKINVTSGTFTLSGGVIKVVYELGGSSLPDDLVLVPGRSYNIITASGGAVVANPAVVDSSNIAQLYKFDLDYSVVNNVNLIVRTDLKRAAITPPQKLMADGLDLIGYNDTADINSVYVMAHNSYKNLDMVRTLFDGIYPINIQGFHDGTQKVHDLLGNNLARRYALSNQGRKAQAEIVHKEPKVEVLEYHKKYASGKKSKNFILKEIVYESNQYGVFADGSVGADNHGVVTGNVNVIAGVDSMINDDVMVGVAFTYTDNKVDAARYTTKFVANNAALYANYDNTKLFWNGFLSSGLITYTGSRTLAPETKVNDVFSYAPNGYNWMLNSSLGYKINLHKFAVSPYITGSLVSTTVEAYQETARSNLKLAVDTLNFMFTEVSFGAKFEYYIDTTWCKVIPYVNLKTSINAYNSMSLVKLNFVQYTSSDKSFSMSENALIPKEYISLQTGILLQGNKYISAYMGYNMYIQASSAINTAGTWLFGVHIAY